MIISLLYNEGRWITERKTIGNHIVQYFNNTFQTNSPNDLSCFVGLFRTYLNEQENNARCEILSLGEIKRQFGVFIT